MKSLITLSFMPCHRIPERSLVVRNHQFPVCFRCMGIVTGIFIGIIVNWFYLFSVLTLAVGGLLMIPMLIDGYTQMKRWRVSNNPLRLTTGMMFGWGLAIGIVYLSRSLIYLILAL
ncbi:DUF2085 domain-containing protein [Bacillus sp. Marseille-Q1617]|uniref:DUF2085 domain-containing protein n=1 Tax=Bacillus sp. Marseille-Q1617 TaxID=2736887 RepID=UPI001C37C600|nr:DUF2085 domain-containing protein [Bacillus sp. Marseille-Q1617]